MKLVFLLFLLTPFTALAQPLEISVSFGPATLGVTTSPLPKERPTDIDPPLVETAQASVSGETDTASGPGRPKARPDNLTDLVLQSLPTSLDNTSDAFCLKVALYHEARGESSRGQLAVASVILQRVDVAHRWGDRICDVVVPVQFSFLNEDNTFEPITDFDAWRTATRLARRALDGLLPPLARADHYHTDYVSPDWAQEMVEITQIGQHIFYRDPLSFLGS